MLDYYTQSEHSRKEIMTGHYQKTLEHVRQQIGAKCRARDQLNAEIAQLQAVEIGVQTALGQQIKAETAWTDLVRTVVYAARHPLTAVEVRDTLAGWGYTFAGIKNPLAFCNTILQRLAEQRELVRSDVGRPFKFSCEE
jgi:hypothetical protein